MANVAAKFGLASGGSLFGVTPPMTMAGFSRLPEGFFVDPSSSITLTASRYYYAPYYLQANEVWSGVKFRDNGAGNNGRKVKLATFSVSPTTGALDAVAKNFGEVTLDGVEGIETLASSWTVPATGWYWLGLTSDAATSCKRMLTGNPLTAVGYLPGPGPYGAFGADSATLFSSLGAAMTPGPARYGAGTYANFPEASPIAPTVSIDAALAVSVPLFGLYKA